MNPPSDETLFAEALKRPPAERTAFLDQACAGASAQRARLEALLGVEARAQQFLASLPLAATRSAVAPPPPPEAPPAEPRIGHYKLLQRLGEGGCGTVWLAEQEEPVRRRVAVKVIKLGMDTREVIARFEAERQALAMMDHPNIAKVYDAGTTEGGRPYFVMELVRGVPITAFCDERKLSTAARLELFTQVCHAVQHAHQKGIIHRDIKPSNILVALHDDLPVPKVIDFGIAKATGGRLTDQTLYTAVEQFIGTPAYMSPEQAQVSVVDIDTRSDIYSLGVLLYELLTGRTPFDTAELLKIGIDEMRRHIREVDPPRPSTRLGTMQGEALSTTAQRRQIAPPKLISLVRGDLDWIVMRCLEKDRARRYETANGLAADLLRYLHQEPVTACPPSQWYRLNKLVRRNKLAFGAAAAVTVALLLGLAASLWQAVRASRAELATRNEAAVAKAVNDFLVQDLLRQADSRAQADTKIAPDPDLKVSEALDRAAEKVGDRFKDQPRIEAEIRSAIGSAYQGVGEYGKAVLHHERALEIRRRMLGRDHPGTLLSMHEFATAYLAAGRHDLALPLFEETLRLRKAKLGPVHSATLSSMNNLAAAYQAAGKLDQALSLHEETLKLTRAKLGLDHPGTLPSMSNLASAYQKAGKRDQALPLFEDTLKLMRAKLGPEHPDTLNSMNNLATAYHDAGKGHLALPLFEETLRLCKAKLGPEHPDTLKSMSNLAGVYQSAGQRDRALPLYEETLRLRKAKLGPEHPETLTSINNLASAYRAAGKLDQALPLFEETLRLQKAKLGPEHPSALNTMSNLAGAYKDAGKLDQALPLYEDTLRLRKTVLGPEHPNTLTSVNDLAVAYVRVGKPAQAVPLHEETLRLRKAKLGLDHPDTLQSMSNLAEAYRSIGNLDQALRLHEETLKLRKAMLGPDHPNTLMSMNNLGVAYRAVGKLDQALSLHEETLKLRKAKLGPDHPSMLTSMNNLASTYQAAGKPNLALPLFEEALRLRKAKLGTEHPDTLASMNNLASAYQAVGKLDQAVPLFEKVLRLRRGKQGPEDPNTLSSINNLAVAYRDAGKSAQAVPLFEAVFKMRKARLGSEHPDTLTAMSNLADAYRQEGKSAEAAALLAPLADIWTRAQGPEHSSTLTTMRQWAAVEEDLGRLAEAEAKLRRLLSILQRQGGSAVNVATHETMLGRILLKQQKFAEAEGVLRPALAVRTAKQPDNWTTLVTRYALGGALAGLARYVEAEPLLISAYEGLAKRVTALPAEGKVRLKETLELLVRLYTDRGKPDQAAEWQKKLDEFNAAAARPSGTPPASPPK